MSDFIIEEVIDDGKRGYAYIPKSDIINQIEQIRIRNNKNWMDILRIAFKYAPDEAGEVFKRISECDLEINKLSKKLGESK